MFDFTKTILLALTSIAIVAPTVSAQTVLSPAQTQRVVNSLNYPTSSQRFYERGQQQFAREIDRITTGQFPPSESILKISDEVMRRDRIENPTPTESNHQIDFESK